MAEGLHEVEAEILIELSTGSVIKYKCKYETGLSEVSRTLITPEGENTVTTSIENILKDGERLTKVGLYFQGLVKLD